MATIRRSSKLETESKYARIAKFPNGSPNDTPSSSGTIFRKRGMQLQGAKSRVTLFIEMVFITSWYWFRCPLGENRYYGWFKEFGGLMGRSQADNSGVLQNRSLADNFVQFMVDSSNFCHSREPFVTREGYIGLGPQGMQAGDLCSILFGAQLHYILRRVSGRYVIFGESYIHGVMQGEISRCLAKSRFRGGDF